MSLCNKIALELKNKYPNILDYEILGLSRGGLVPSVIISNILNIRKVYTLGLKSYNNEEKSEFEIYQVPELSPIKNVLIIDDISDTGDSFKAVADILGAKNIVTASIFLKNKSAFKPNIYGKIVKDDVWVVFPWE